MIRITSVIGGIMVLFIIWLVRDNMHKRKVNDTISSLNKKLNFMARYDALTSLLNRRVFMEDLQYRIREKEPFGLIMFDMDNFKRINDVYGHNEGDAVLKEMAARAGALVDDVFEVYRLAGDEFVAIVQSGQKEVIDSYAMKILDTFKIPYRIAGGEQYLASSIGIAVYPKDGKNSTEVIAAADHAMYKVKKIINITDCEKKCCHKQKDDSYLREYKSSFLLVKNYFFILARLRKVGSKIRLRIRRLSGVTSRSSSTSMKSSACSKLKTFGGTSVSASSAEEERVLVRCFFLHTFNSISSALAQEPMTIPA